MRDNPTLTIERARLTTGPFGTDSSYGCTGAFVVKLNGIALRIIASDASDESAQGWEHVSVSLLHRAPKWSEMQWVKQQFWKDDEVVFQLHPAERDYVNCHPNCLHMWRHVVLPCPRPPAMFVGPKEVAR